MHPMDEYTDDTCDNDGWYDFYDLVLIVEAVDSKFANRFWEYVVAVDTV